MSKLEKRQMRARTRGFCSTSPPIAQESPLMAKLKSDSSGNSSSASDSESNVSSDDDDHASTSTLRQSMLKNQEDVVKSSKTTSTTKKKKERKGENTQEKRIRGSYCTKFREEEKFSFEWSIS